MIVDHGDSESEDRSVTATDLEKLVHRCLDGYYRRRIEKLRSFRLRDALKTANPCLLALESQEMSKIVERLIEAHMASSDEPVFNDWFSGLEDTDLYLKLVAHTRSYPLNYASSQMAEFETEMSKVCNRTVREFAQRFCHADGNLDWEGLLRLRTVMAKLEGEEVTYAVRS
jgi:hypothetical protein